VVAIWLQTGAIMDILVLHKIFRLEAKEEALLSNGRKLVVLIFEAD